MTSRSTPRASSRAFPGIAGFTWRYIHFLDDRRVLLCEKKAMRDRGALEDGLRSTL